MLLIHQVINSFRILQPTPKRSAYSSSIEEVGTNPFGGSFNIKSKSILHNILVSPHFWMKNKTNLKIVLLIVLIIPGTKQAIDVINRMIASSRNLGITGAIFFALISLLITFNTISLAIYMAREEISVMRLVGASTRYIRGPFVVSGLIYGLCASVLSLVLILPIVYWVGPKIYDLGTGINLLQILYLQIFLNLLALSSHQA